LEKQYSVACLIVGILSCVLCCMCVGFPLGIAGVVLFVLSTRNGNEADAKAVIGLILSIVGFILSAISAVFIIIAILNSPDTDRNYYNHDSVFDYFDYDNDSLDYDDDYKNLPYEYDDGVFEYNGSDGLNEF